MKVENKENNRKIQQVAATMAIPVASTQIPITRLDTADDPIALYIFSFIKTNLLKLTKFNILIHSYFNTTSVDIATWICYS